MERGREKRMAGLTRWAGLCLVFCGAIVMSSALAARVEPADESGRLGAAVDLREPAAALARARAQLDAGERRQAIQLLGEISQRYPVIGDYADLLRARLLLESGEGGEAAAAMLQALQTHADSPLRGDFYALLGDARVQVDEAAARSAWDTARAETRDRARQSKLMLKVAESHERSGQLDEAADSYRGIWISHPTSDEAPRAQERLAALEARRPEALRTPSDWRRRGDTLFRRRRNDEALEAYDRSLKLGLSTSEKHRAQRQRAHTLFRMRRYPQAIEAFSSLPQRDDVPLWRARSLARAGQVPESIKEFEVLAGKSRGELSMRATFLAALLLDGRDEAVRARAHYETVAGTPASSGLRNAALWRLGWSAYRELRYEDAVGYFDELIKAESDPIAGLRHRYWRARCLGHMADARATVEFAEIANTFPLTYYGWRSASLASDGAEPPQAPEIKPGSALLSPRALARPRILIEAGMLEEAADEMSHLRRRARSLIDRLELAELLSEAGQFNEAQRLVVDPYNVDLARGPVPQYLELWWHAWPTAFGQLVDRATETPDSVEPELVFSIMREESGYRAEVVSAAGARGLLQIMDDTGARLARAMGHEPYHVDDLFDPATNITLGVHYLGELSRHFTGWLPGAIASYNAGPQAVGSWAAEDIAEDEWVEAIPYEQTRSYVKRVLRSLHAYRVLY